MVFIQLIRKHSGTNWVRDIAWVCFMMKSLVIEIYFKIKYDDIVNVFIPLPNTENYTPIIIAIGTSNPTSTHITNTKPKQYIR
jgi:hypothetical protein